MKKKSLIILLLAISITTISILPISAKRPIDFSASGTIDTYYEIDSCQIIGGSWSIKTTKNQVLFEAIYLEENLDAEIENSPVGSIDKFELKLVKVGFSYWEDDTFTVVGIVRYKKEWQMMDGTTKTVIWLTGSGIEVTPTGIRIAHEPDLMPGDKLGTTLIYELS